MSDPWDVLVIGAGPAGAIAARQAARAGLRTLLVEKKPFPREKVCGACLNPRALALLCDVGLTSVVQEIGGAAIRQLDARNRGRRLTIALPGGLAVSRATFDAALVRHAMAAGVEFWPETTAEILPPNRDDVCQVAIPATLDARVVVVADGLGHPSLSKRPEFHSRVTGTKIGIGVTLPREAADEFEPGTIFMAVGPAGYVGLVRIEDGRLNLAAALEPRFVQQSASLADAVSRTLVQAGFPLPCVDGAMWRGTLPLTRAAVRRAGRRLFLIGDAASYVEPFTGEGIAAAMQSAIAVTPLVVEAARCWHDRLANQWEQTYGRQIVRRQFICRALARLLNHPAAIQAAMTAVTWWPGLANAIVRRVCGGPQADDRLTHNLEESIA